MSNGRASAAQRVATLVGQDVLHVAEGRDGWPALASLSVDRDWRPVALFAGPVGLSHRARDGVERRFQNPGSNRPISISPGRHPLLVGLWEDDPQLPVPRPLLVMADPYRRQDRLTRFSMFVTVAALLEASRTGWSTSVNESGETIRCLLPPLLPVAVSADLDGVAPASIMIQNAVAASGLADTTDDPTAAARARRASMSLVRDARFSRLVISAYRGRCAMCGLCAPFLQGAHIYPAAALGSQDQPWNGLALCPNHHLAFDYHLIGVRPATNEIRFKENMLAQAQESPALTALIDTTFPILATPDDPRTQPRPEMFHRRYDHFTGCYDWLA